MGRNEINNFMLNGIQLILTPIVCFEMKLECEMSCQNVNCDDKILGTSV